MGLIYNHADQRDFRRELRHEQTGAEKLFWNSVRADQLGVHFRRQYSVDKYILDFYCPKLKLAIELDGAVHDSDEAKINDEERTLFLTGFGIEVLRFTNSEIFGNLDLVVKKVIAAIKERQKTTLR